MGNENEENKELRIRILSFGIIVICFDFFCYSDRSGGIWKFWKFLYFIIHLVLITYFLNPIYSTKPPVLMLQILLSKSHLP